MHLVQLLLPLYDRRGNPVAEEKFSAVRRELARRFGGVTAYSRSPATGLWKKPRGGIERDVVLLFEVLTPRLSRPWWREYRRSLEKSFRQEQILLLASSVSKL